MQRMCIYVVVHISIATSLEPIKMYTTCYWYIFSSQKVAVNHWIQISPAILPQFYSFHGRESPEPGFFSHLQTKAKPYRPQNEVWLLCSCSWNTGEHESCTGRVRYSADVLHTTLSSSWLIFRYTEGSHKAIVILQKEIARWKAQRYLGGYGVQKKGQD